MCESTFSHIRVIHSPCKEKVAVPRQPSLDEDGGGELHLNAPNNHPEAVRGQEDFSNLWLLFVLQHTRAGGWRHTV
ncbi:TrmO family methyltransferase, partial [Erwinia amylovora]|uniref:TrmO family methyltransferase domain-containing protein n=1 Tax=Erwinia amylovora TaxID=552 RepID=UPI0020C11D7D